MAPSYLLKEAARIHRATGAARKTSGSCWYFAPIVSSPPSPYPGSAMEAQALNANWVNGPRAEILWQTLAQAPTRRRLRPARQTYDTSLLRKKALPKKPDSRKNALLSLRT